MSKKKISPLFYLSPVFIIKNYHLSKTDVVKIKYSLLRKICVVSLVIAALLFLSNLVSLFTMGSATGWNQIEVYGITSFIGQMTSFLGSACTFVFTTISLKSKNIATKNRFAHIANVLVFVTMLIYLFSSMYADASKGFLSETPTLSASIILVSFFLMIQPVFWIEAMILDGMLSLGLIVTSIVFTNVYHIQGLMYYLFVAFFFPVSAYVIVSVLFYAESQRYREELRNESLNNTANYDELTHCKNRRALKEAIEENNKKWKNGYENTLLVMMFDIDDFKLYNDQYSHISGDYCLKSIADCIKKAFPSPSLDFYRFGGEEFLFFLEIEDKKQADENIEKVRIAVEELKMTAAKGAPYEYVTISLGGTIVEANENSDLNEAIKLADKYLYQAKASGKNLSVIDGKPIAK